VVAGLGQLDDVGRRAPALRVVTPAVREVPPLLRLPLLLLGMAALVIGSLAGLARLGVEVPALAQAQAGGHGALMVAAFFGTVISLERAVALRRLWPYVGPLSAGLGGLALLAGTPAWVPPALFALGGAVLTGASGLVLRQQPALYTVTLALGALGWLAGHVVWLASGDPAAAVPFWIAFLVLTIAGERLELTRFLPPRLAASTLFAGLLTLVVVDQPYRRGRPDGRPRLRPRPAGPRRLAAALRHCPPDRPPDRTHPFRRGLSAVGLCVARGRRAARPRRRLRHSATLA
jgi:hypothetical protein